jgi:hypothetical protein
VNIPEDRYRAEITQVGRWVYQVQIIAKSTIQLQGDMEMPGLESCLEMPPHVIGRRWAAWKARRMLAAIRRRAERRANKTVIR